MDGRRGCDRGAVRHGRRLIERKQGIFRCRRFLPACGSTDEAEEAANFYVSLLPDSQIETVQQQHHRRPAGKAGTVLVVEFTLAGQRFMALNGGMHQSNIPMRSPSRSTAPTRPRSTVSGTRSCRPMAATVEQCGWIKDRYGLSWQIVPAALMKYIGGSDSAGAQRAMQAMLGMVKLDIEGLRRAYEGKSAA